MLRSATARLAVTVDFPTPPLPDATAITLAMPPVVVLSLGSGRGAAPPSLMTTMTFCCGNSRRRISSAWFLIFTANGSRALAKRSTTVILPAPEAICSIKPLPTMSCPVSGWTTDVSRCLIFSSMIRVVTTIAKITYILQNKYSRAYYFIEKR